MIKYIIIFTNHDLLLHITIRYITINKSITIISKIWSKDKIILGKVEWYEKIIIIVQRCKWTFKNKLENYFCKLCWEWKIFSSVYFTHTKFFKKIISSLKFKISIIRRILDRTESFDLFWIFRFNFLNWPTIILSDY